MANVQSSNKTDKTDAFFISDSAAKRIMFLATKEKAPVFLRIEVEGGGCSGFQYHMDFDTIKKDDDLLFENDGAKVVIDPTSLPFVAGSILDYVETMSAAAFEIKNPNATANCGCGNSFSV